MGGRILACASAPRSGKQARAHSALAHPASWRSIRGDGLDVLLFALPDFGGAIDEQCPVQMIQLMLEDARQPPGGLDAHGLTTAIQALDGDRVAALHLTNQARD